MSRDRAKLMLLAVAAYLLGASASGFAIWTLTGSARAALIFSLLPAGFVAPVLLLLMVALGRAKAAPTQWSGSVSPQKEVLIASAYLASLLPYWIAAMSFLNGRSRLGLVLLATYALLAVVPLRSLFRLMLLLIQRTAACEDQLRPE